MILALDPDMPAANQAVLFRSSAHRAPLRWRLDGADLGGAGTPLLWIPTPGKHRLALLAEDDTTLDEVRFQVRGSKD
jgi:penicillin-binding protein 1C